MSMTDPIADLLTRIRNAALAGHETLDVPHSRLKAQIVRVLREEGFISDYIVSEEPKPGIIRITLKYTDDRKPVLQGIRRISRPSLRVYQGAQELKQVRSGLGISIVSTNQGVMSGRNARQKRVGGEVICEVW